MKLILLPALLVSLNGFSQTTDFDIDKGKLIGPVQTIRFIYTATGCECAEWLDYRKKNFKESELIFLEPASQYIINTSKLYDGTKFPDIIVTGRFYQKKGYPKNYHPAKGNPFPARVFRYKKIKIISS